jgi:hypothetical protein
MVATGVVTRSGKDEYSALPNNTNPQWVKDKGLRRLNLGVALMFTSAAANGFDGSLMNGLLALPLCMYDSWPLKICGADICSSHGELG